MTSLPSRAKRTEMRRSMPGEGNLIPWGTGWGPMHQCEANSSQYQDVMSKYGRSERIRTSDPIVPNDVRYQAALHSDIAAG
jgi:hypothetical protein